MKRIIITGGHHNSALVIAEKLRSLGHEVIWFGHKFTMQGDREPGAEYREVMGAGLKFVEIQAGKISRRHRLINFLRFFPGFIQSFYYLLSLRPNLIFSFGGYLAVPVVVCGWFLGIPSVTHEQTVAYGWANRIIGSFSKKVFVSWRSSLEHFSSKKAVFTGLPLRPEIFKSRPVTGLEDKRLTIYVTGGKQGSHVINQVIEKSLPDLLGKYNLIHQCGSSTVHNDFSRFKEIKKQLPTKLKGRYFVKDYFEKAEIGGIFSAADLVVSRAGAHIVYEMATLGKPAIFIPIPWSRANEQTENAQELVRAGLAEMLPQEKLSPSSLAHLVGKMMENLCQYKRNAARAKKLVKLNAAEEIIEIIEEL